MVFHAGFVSVQHRNETTNWSEAHLQRDGADLRLADQRKSVKMNTIKENHDHEASRRNRFKSSADSSAPLSVFHAEI